MYFLLKNGDFPASHVSLPEGWNEIPPQSLTVRPVKVDLCKSFQACLSSSPIKNFKAKPSNFAVAYIWENLPTDSCCYSYMFWWRAKKKRRDVDLLTFIIICLDFNCCFRFFTPQKIHHRPTNMNMGPPSTQNNLCPPTKEIPRNRLAIRGSWPSLSLKNGVVDLAQKIKPPKPGFTKT